MYSAAKLQPYSAYMLKKAVSDIDLDGFKFAKDCDKLPHHMTINLGKFSKELNDPSILDAWAKLEVNKIYWSPSIGACAAKVDKAYVDDTEIKTINDNRSSKHITICIKPPANPVDSNKLFGEGDDIKIVELPKPLVLKAKIKEIK